MVGENLIGQKILITGSAGFIGGAIYDRLKNRGFDVIGMDINKISSRGRETDYVLDIRNYSFLEDIILGIQPDIIFHLAAQPIVPFARDDPLTTYEINVMGTWNILFSAFFGKVPNLKAIIMASTDKVYGNSMYASEGNDFHSCGIYESSKIMDEILASTLVNEYHLPIILTRCCNVYGEGDLHLTRIIPGIFNSFYTHEVFYLRSDGRGIREYIYIEDVVDAYLHIADMKLEGKIKNGEAINIANGEVFRTDDLVEKINSEVLFQRLKYQVLDQCKEISTQSLNGDKLKSLEFLPKYKLLEVLPKMKTWYRDWYQND